jgi:ribosomal protein L40E
MTDRRRLREKNLSTSKHIDRRLICRCGNPKSPQAEECRQCFDERTILDVNAVPVQERIKSPRDAFEWIVRQSRGGIS